MAAKKAAPTVIPPTIITLTIPANDAEAGTLLIQRGELAHVRLLPRGPGFDIQTTINDACVSLDAVEAAPPTIPAPPPPSPAPVRPASTYVPPKPVPTEPMLDIPLTKGQHRIKASHLQLIGEQTDAAAMREAMLIAGKLIDGKLWDGRSPISIDDVYGVQRKLKHLSVKDLALFSLEDFAQRVELAPEPVIDTEEPEDAEADELEEVNE